MRLAIVNLVLVLCLLFCSMGPCRGQIPSVNWVQQAGGSGDVSGNSIGEDGSGNIFVAGSFRGSVAFGANILNSSGDNFNGSMFLAKYDQSGNSLWGVAATAGDSYAVALAMDSSGNAYVSGHFYPPAIKFGSWQLTNTKRKPIHHKIGWKRQFPLGGRYRRDKHCCNGISDGRIGVLLFNWFLHGKCHIWRKQFWLRWLHQLLQLYYKIQQHMAQFCSFVGQTNPSRIFWQGGSSGIALDSAGNIYVTGGFGGSAQWGNQGATTNLTSVGPVGFIPRQIRQRWTYYLGVKRFGECPNPFHVRQCLSGWKRRQPGDSRESVKFPLSHIFLCKLTPAAGTELWATSFLFQHVASFHCPGGVKFIVHHR